MGADLAGHLLVAGEQPVDLARVDVDAGDLPLELVADVGVLGLEADVRREVGERVRRQILELGEVVPPGVREVLVERRRCPAYSGPGHHPAAALGEQADADVTAELVVDVVADPEREVQLLRLEPDDLAAEDVERRVVVGAGRVQELVVVRVAAEHGVRQVEEHDRCLGERA